VKIILTEVDIKAALTESISQQGFNLTGKRVEVSMTAGRGTNGHTAQLEILPEETAEESEEIVPLSADENTGTEEDQQAIAFDE